MRAHTPLRAMSVVNSATLLLEIRQQMMEKSQHDRPFVHRVQHPQTAL
jgi:hypothetical protein